MVKAYHFDKPQNHQYLNDRNLLFVLGYRIRDKEFLLSEEKWCKFDGTYTSVPILCHRNSDILGLDEFHFISIHIDIVWFNIFRI